MSSLDLGIIGNCTISALIDRVGTIVWSCFPRFDGDPLFCKLLNDGAEHGFIASSSTTWWSTSSPICRTPRCW